MMNDELIKGIFMGMLLAAFLMLIAPKPTHCTIEVQRGQVTTVTFGRVYD